MGQEQSGIIQFEGLTAETWYVVYILLEDRGFNRIEAPGMLEFKTKGTPGSTDRYNAAFITNNGGTVGSAFNALVAGLDAGQAYLNVHTNLFPGGEIRGLLAPVPEPQTYALMLAGLGVLGWAARRRQAS